MEDEIRFRDGRAPGVEGFATPHVAGVEESEPEGEVNDSMGTVHPADTMDTDPDTDPEAGDKGTGEKVAE